jgi:hypothetical protein
MQTMFGADRPATPAELRRARVAKRNAERDPQVFAFEVTEAMFAFMEPRFKPPEDEELSAAVHVTSS